MNLERGPIYSGGIFEQLRGASEAQVPAFVLPRAILNSAFNGNRWEAALKLNAVVSSHCVTNELISFFFLFTVV